MDSLGVYVGLDYHDAGVQACAMESGGHLRMNRRQPNDWRAIVEAVNGIASGRPVYAALEACTGAADLAEELVSRAGWTVNLAHPGYVARMKQNLDKHDWGDARILADLVRVGYLPKVWLPPQEIRELRRLVRYRQQLIHHATKTKLRIRALLREHRLRRPGSAWTRAWMHWVENTAPLPAQSRWLMSQHLRHLCALRPEITAVEKRLRQVTKRDAVVSRLLQHKGIGPVTAWTIRAEIGRFDRFRSGKQLSKFCGLSPRNKSTDRRTTTAGLIETGNRELRAILIEAAHRLARHDPRWQQLAKSLRGEGKPGSVIAAAVANRWMRWLYHQMQPTAQTA